MITKMLALKIFAVVLLTGCAQFHSSESLPAGAPITAAGQDLSTAVAQATQAYVEAKNGNADFAWSVKKGVDAYQLFLKTKADVQTIVQQWSDGTKAGKTFAEKVAALFASSTAPPAAKAAAISQGVQMEAQNSGP